MKKLLLFSLLAFYTQINAQNVGIGNPAPAEKLDVTGNINLTGTIKANGVDGTAGQVLMKNNAGNLAWGNLNDFKKFTSFTNAGTSFTWIVPTDVTKIGMELWGGGGGGNNFGGGGGGGYAFGIVTVVPGETITIDVGLGGTGAASLAAGDGTFSKTYRGGITLTANGGNGAEINLPGYGGSYLTNAGSSLISYLGREGEAGSPTEEDFDESAVGVFVRKYKFGNGGNAANTANTSGKGGFRMINAATMGVITSISPAYPTSPGGGGGGGQSGQNGAKGLVIIHY